MSDAIKAKGNIYEVRVKGQLDNHWAAWFDGMTVRAEANGQTVLSGVIVDQAALNGVLRRIFALGLALISVNRVESDTEQQHSTHCKNS